jgi:hypothetical protein
MCVALAVGAAIVSVLPACRDDPQLPALLADGRTAQVAQVPFEGVDVPVVRTAARVVRDGASGCTGTRAAGSRSVERVGVDGTSATTVSEDAGSAWACDSTPVRARCGHAFVRLRPARMWDPRLSVTCSRPDGSPLGFVWIRPSPRSAYVVVRGDAYAEAYPAVGGLPVRVTTRDIDLATTSARLRYSEHTATGVKIADAVLDARVSG